MGADPSVVDKESARFRFRRLRSALTGPELTGAGEELRATVLRWLGPADDGGRRPLVAAYLSMGDEPATPPLLAALTDAGYDVVVPVCEPHRQLTWCRWAPGVELVRSVRAPLLEPVGPRSHFGALRPFRLVLVPALAVDTAGNRLGQGGGYYDRFLAQLLTHQPLAETAAVIYDHELVPEHTFGTSVLDMPLGQAFTPTGHRPLGSAERAV